MRIQLLIRQFSISQRFLRWTGLFALSAAISLQAARVDPDFRPVFGYGFGGDDFNRFEAVMPDGRLVLNNGYERWFVDGSLDPSYDPPNDGRRTLRVLHTGQLVAHYRTGDTMHPCKEDPLMECGPFEESRELVWLDSSGRKTDVGFDLGPDGSSLSSGEFYPYVNGQHLLYGAFESVNGITRSRLARINGDGSVDTSFDAGFLSNKVRGIWPQADGKILVWGNFIEFGGQSLPGLVRLKSDGTIDSTFTPDSPSGGGPVAEDSEGRILRAFPGAIYSSDANGTNLELLVEYEDSGRMEVKGFLPVEDGAFLVWGDFIRIGGVDRPFLARVNTDGSVDTGFNANAVLASGPRPSGGYLRRIHRMDDGRLVPFVTGLWRLMPDGSVDSSLQPENLSAASIEAIAVQADGQMVVAGLFTQANGLIRSGLVRLNSSGVVDPMFDPGNQVVANEISSIAVGPDDAVWVGGGPAELPTNRRARLVRHQPDGAIDPDLHLEFDEKSVVRTVAVDSLGRVYFGGRFRTVNGHARNGLARLNADHTVDPLFADGIALTGLEVEVTHLEILDDGGLLVAGAFDAWQGVRRWGLFKLNADGELNTDFVPNEALAGLRVAAAAAHEDGSVGVASLNGDYNPVSAIHLLDPLGHEVALKKPSLADHADILDVVVLPGGVTIFSVVPTSDGVYDPDRNYPPFLLALASDGEPGNRFIPEFDSNAVKAMAALSDGSIVLAGDFDGVDGMDFANLMRVVGLDQAPGPRMANISTRGFVSDGDRQLIAGFVVEGTEPQRVLIRGVGPTLEDFGIEHALAHPVLELRSSSNAEPIAVSYPGDWWIGDRYNAPKPKSRVIDMFNRVGAFDLTGSAPSGPGHPISTYDAVVMVDLDPGAYTVKLSGENSAIGLVEVFNATGVEADRRITNLSTRGWIGLDNERLIGGFVVDRGPKRVLVRAVGPSLEGFGVTGFLEDPQIRIIQTDTVEEVDANDNWEDTGAGTAITEATQIVGAFHFDTGSLDSALILDLEPGNYTAIVSGVGGTTGIALVEVYELPDEL